MRIPTSSGMPNASPLRAPAIALLRHRLPAGGRHILPRGSGMAWSDYVGEGRMHSPLDNGKYASASIAAKGTFRSGCSDLHIGTTP